MGFASADELSRFVNQLRAELDATGLQGAPQQFTRIQPLASSANSVLRLTP